MNAPTTTATPCAEDYKIVAAINSMVFAQMGIRPASASRQIFDLRQVSLQRILSAVESIRVHEAGARKAGEHRYITVLPDDRVVAAAYALTNYSLAPHGILAREADPDIDFGLQGDAPKTSFVLAIIRSAAMGSGYVR